MKNLVDEWITPYGSEHSKRCASTYALWLRRVALGIAGIALTIVDTCLKSGWLAVIAAKTRGKAAKLMHRLIWARLGKEAIYLVFSEVKILSWDADGNPRHMPCAFVLNSTLAKISGQDAKHRGYSLQVWRPIVNARKS